MRGLIRVCIYNIDKEWVENFTHPVSVEGGVKREKRLSCRDVGTDCDYVACGKTEEEVFQKAAEHSRTGHGMNEISKELYDKARSAIREVDHC